MDEKQKEISSFLVPSNIRRLLTAYLFLLSGGYLLQLLTPLRINTDSYRLLSMAVSAYHGYDYLVDGNPDQFPLGYPFIVKVLLESGLGDSMSLVALNLLFLITGLYILQIWCKREGDSIKGIMGLMCVAFVLSSWVMIKHITLPLTEMPYFAVSSLSLLFLWIFWQNNGRSKWLPLVVALLLGLVAIQFRTIGITIFPALVVTVFFHEDIFPYTSRILTNTRFYTLTVSAFILLLFIGIFFIRDTNWFESQFIRPESYFQRQLYLIQSKGFTASIFQNIFYRVSEFGEIFTNIPSSKVSLLSPIQFLAGIIAWFITIYGTWFLINRRQMVFLPLYFISYATVMLAWPYYDARFWLPVLPVLAVITFTGLEELLRKWPALSLASWSYVIWFFLLGIASIIFSTRISLAGKEFSEVFGDKSMQMTYRYAFQNGKKVDCEQVNQGLLNLLRIFEPLASKEKE
jgi:hypothetical protein